MQRDKEYGTFYGGYFLETLHKILNNVYLPLIENSQEHDKEFEIITNLHQDFESQLRKFVKHLDYTNKQLHEGNSIEIPERKGVEPKEAVKDEAYVEEIEKDVENWTHEIQKMLEEVRSRRPPQSTDLDGPLAEIEYWRQRANSVATFWDQLNNHKVKYVINVLELYENSQMLDNFHRTFGELTKVYMEATENVKFLETLERHFKNIRRAREDLLPIIDTLPSMMRALKMVWSMSRQYNTEKRMQPLMTLIANEIARKVEQYLRIESEETMEMMFDNSDLMIEKLRQSQTVLERWESSYNEQRAQIIEEGRSSTWSFETDKLFEKTNYMRDRCMDLIKVVKNVKKNKEFLGPQMVHATGNKDGVRDVLFAVRRLIDPIEKFEGVFKIGKLKDWVEVMVEFDDQCELVSKMIVGFVDRSFKKLNSAQSQFQLLTKLQEAREKGQYAQTSLDSSVDEKRDEILGSFFDEVKLIHQIFDKEHTNPPKTKNLPPVAGAIYWAETLYQRIFKPIDIIKKKRIFLENERGRVVKNKCEVVGNLIRDYQIRRFKEWKTEVEGKTKKYLQQNILVREGGKGKVNFDHKLTLIIQETKYLGKLISQLRMEEEGVRKRRKQEREDEGMVVHNTGLKFWTNFDDVPRFPQNVALQESKYHHYVEELKLMLEKYDSTTGMLDAPEQKILKKSIIKLEKKLREGYYTLNWNSLAIGRFISECNNEMSMFRIIVEKLQKNSRILKGLINSIRNTYVVIPLDQLYKKKYDIDSLFNEMKKHQEEQVRILVKKYNTISQTLLKIKGDLISFNVITTNDSNELEEYYKYWEENIFNALSRMLFRNIRLLLKFRKTPGIITVHVTLQHQKISTNPNGDDVGSVMDKIAKSVVLETTKHFIRWAPGTCEKLTPEALDLQHLMVEDMKSYIEKKGSFYADIWPTFGKEKEVVVSTKQTRYLRLFFNQIQKMTQECMVEVDELVNNYNGFSKYWERSLDQSIKKFAENNPSFEKFESKLEHIMKDIENINLSERTFTKNFIHVDFSELRESIKERCLEWIQEYGKLLGDRLAKPLLHRIREEFRSFHLKLDSPIEELDDLRSVLSTIEEIHSKSIDIERRIMKVQSYFYTIMTYDIKIRSEEKKASSKLGHLWKQLLKKTLSKEKSLKSQKIRFTEKTKENVAKFFHAIELFQEKLNEGPFSRKIEVDRGLDVLDECEEELAKLQTTRDYLVLSEKLFDLPITPYPNLAKIEESMTSEGKVYKFFREFKVHEDAWSQTLFKYIQATEMHQITNEFKKKLLTEFVDAGLSETITYGKVKKRIIDFERSIPLFKCLLSEALKPRHWVAIMERTGVKIDIESSDFTLQKLIEMRLFNFESEIAEISSNARIEKKMEEDLDNIEDGWANRKFSLKEYQRNNKKRGYLVVEKDDVKVLIEEDTMKLSAIAGSPNIEHFEGKLVKLTKMLSEIDDNLDLWIDVQTAWINLEVIFIGSRDIREQLPELAREFDRIDDTWGKIMIDVGKNRNIREATRLPGRRTILDQLKKRLQRCQKKLSNYLQTKRELFPRFYYLSNDELLSILGSSNPKFVQLQVSKLFGNCKSLIMKDNSNIVCGMESGEGEEFFFKEQLTAEGPVEQWLEEVTVQMKKSLKRITKEAVYHYPRKHRTKWIGENLGMVALCGCQIWWTWEVEHSFEKVKAGQKTALKDLSKKLTKQINDIVSGIRKKGMTSQKRKKSTTCIIIDVHARDIVDILVRDSILDERDFAWESQLRFYWERKPDTCVIRQCTGEFDYGYEYQGLNGRLVITPLTDRCFMTLTQALTFNLGGSPAGPAGTGKTESCKDLAKALGRMCVVFNCNKSLNNESMHRLFAGLCQNGAWGCFDEFNRIGVSVLSVIASQIHQIQDALIEGKTVFRFEEQDIGLDKNVGVFVTMNPGYAGRVELPDNLKALFRPCVMVVPDMEIICEVLLFSEGFVRSRPLSRMMVKLYQLAAGQLSKQKHYDWGLRAIKSVLTKAGELKVLCPQEAFEEKLLMKALYDMNVAKFIYEDRPLFEELLKDLFVTVEIDKQSNQGFYEMIKKCLKRKKYWLSKDEFQIKKVVQLFDTMKARHATMVVGGTSGGKSVVIETLREAQSELGYETKLFYINPKAQTVNELYGVMNLETKDWEDGILSNIFREINTVSENRNIKEQRYIVFDGDVDTVWVESMNSLMDDNKLLTLQNGERISLLNQCKLLFEVGDLSYASPATISRSGMVYVDPKNLGYQPFFEKWMDEQFPISGVASASRNKDGGEKTHDGIEDSSSFDADIELDVDSVIKDPVALRKKMEEERAQRLDEIENKEIRKHFDRLFKNYLVRAIDFVVHGIQIDRSIDKPLELVIPQTSLNMVNQLCALLQSFEKDFRTVRKFHLQIETLFLFCVVWSVGACVVEKQRPVFDKYLKSISNLNSTDHDHVPPGYYPERGTLFDYYFSIVHKTWFNWTHKVEVYKPPVDDRFSSILVPTVDTARYKYFLRQMIRIKKKVLFVGVPGTAKTVIINNFISHLVKKDKSKYSSLNVYFTSRSTSRELQRTIEDQIDKGIGDTYVPKDQKHMFMFLDDLNMPKVDEYGTQQPIAWLKFLFEHSAFYERRKITSNDKVQLKYLDKVDFMSAMVPPSFGRNPVDPRFLSKFVAFNLTFPSDDSIRKIYTSILDSHFRKYQFKRNVIELAAMVTESTLQMHKYIVTNLPPTPSKFHYLFNLRDLSRVYEGMCLSSKEHFNEPWKIVKLWRNETMRVYHDRLINNEDRQMVSSRIDSLAREINQRDFYRSMEPPLLFGEFDIQRKAGEGEYNMYQDLHNYAMVRKFMKNKIIEYNTSEAGGGSGEMNLVLFDDAIENLIRIYRIIKMDKGHALLIGVGGSGKKSLTRLAAFLAEYKVFTILLERNYNQKKFVNDLKRLFIQLGQHNQPTVFLFSDAHVIERGFLEYINNLLTSGVIYALFEHDEKLEILSALASEARGLGFRTEEDQWRYFIEKCKNNLHVVLAMSPGKELRDRCRDFPGLVNNTTINWFNAWPEDALLEVAGMYLQEEDLSDEMGKLFNREIEHLMVNIHQSVIGYSKEFFSKYKRYNYVTPKNYINFIRSYINLYHKKVKEIEAASDRLGGGLSQLSNTKEEVEILKNTIAKVKKETDDKASEVQRLQEDLAIQQEESTLKRKQSIDKGKELSIKEKELSVSMNEANKLLMEAEPLLDKAQDALNRLEDHRAECFEMKKYVNPHEYIKQVGNLLTILLTDERGVELNWHNARAKMGSSNFISELVNFDKDRITKDKVRRIKAIVKEHDLTTDKIEKFSGAAAVLMMYIESLIQFHSIYSRVKPLRKKSSKLSDELNKCTNDLKVIEENLRSIQRRIKNQEAERENHQKEMERLKEDQKLNQRKLRSANKLIKGLSSEENRWETMIETYKKKKVMLIGDCLLAAAFLCYLGPFTWDYRKQMLYNDWVKEVNEKDVPVSTPFEIKNILVTDVEIAKWETEGLPSDEISVQNGIFTTRATRFPLCIDPQLQAISWLKSRFSKGLMIKNFGDDYMKVLENCARAGTPFLFENVGETLDPFVDPILDIDFLGKRRVIHLGEEEIDVNKDFAMFMCSRLSNPVYSPEIQSKTMIINYTVTRVGLEEQLLNEVVKVERGQWEEDRVKLIKDIADSKTKLQDLESEILHDLNAGAESKQSVLDNVELIETLEKTQEQVISTTKNLSELEEKTSKIQQQRELFRPVAKRGAILFFVMSSLSSINSMYEYSLTSYLKDVFRYSLKYSKLGSISTTAGTDAQRIKRIIDYLTRRVYSYTCNGLFEKDKLTFSLVLAIKILEGEEVLSSREIDFFMKGNISLQGSQEPKPHEWMSDSSWKDLLHLKKVSSVFQEVTIDLAGNGKAWKAWVESEHPEAGPYPPHYRNISSFQKLCLLRCFRTDRVIKGVEYFISGSEYLGHEFISPPVLSYKQIYSDSLSTSPIICMISPGYDPAQSIMDLAERKSIRCNPISLGQGVGEKAKELIERGIQKGHWVLLQNCHLLVGWLSEVEKILNRMDQGMVVREKFRLWMTSEITPDFPVSILQRSQKIVAEPPNSLKLNMISCYQTLTEEKAQVCKHPCFRPLVFVLTYFHAVIQERRKYGKIGWNVPYDFNVSDYSVSFDLLATYLTKSLEISEQESVSSMTLIPWASLRYLVGEAMYGGRVTDFFDRRILMTYLNEYMGDFLFDTFQPFHFYYRDQADKVMSESERKMKFLDKATFLTPVKKKIRLVDDDEQEEETEGEEEEEKKKSRMSMEEEQEGKKIIDYKLPEDCSKKFMNVEEYVEHVEQTIMKNNSPDVIGLHPNAEISYLKQSTTYLLQSLVTLETASSSSGSSTSGGSSSSSGGSSGGGTEQDQKLVSRCRRILSHFVPAQFDRHALRQRIGIPGPMEVVFLQEVDHWNNLVQVMKSSLTKLDLALEGKIRMSLELEDLGIEIGNGAVPQLWRKFAPSTKKNLADWLEDLQQRYEQYLKWSVDLKDPDVVWLSGFHIPQGYLTSLVQVTCRKYKWPLDKVVLFTEVMDIEDEDEIEEKPEDGCYVRGLYLEGARWDKENKMLAEQEKKKLIYKLPIMKITPVELSKLKIQNTFRTPVYFTTERNNAAGRGIVFEANLATKRHDSHWILKGVALVMNSD